jgi:chromosome segregation ATPase
MTTPTPNPLPTPDASKVSIAAEVKRLKEELSSVRSMNSGLADAVIEVTKERGQLRTELEEAKKETETTKRLKEELGELQHQRSQWRSDNAQLRTELANLRNVAETISTAVWLGDLSKEHRAKVESALSAYTALTQKENTHEL